VFLFLQKQYNNLSMTIPEKEKQVTATAIREQDQSNICGFYYLQIEKWLNTKTSKGKITYFTIHLGSFTND